MDAFSLKILIVEDDLPFALQLEMQLDELNYHVMGRVDNSVDALRIINNDDRPDLILMDIDIKGRLSGLEIGQQINHLNIPILYITSSMDEQNYELAKNSNMIGYLVKPVNKISLRAAIQLAISKTASKLSLEQRAYEIKIEDNIVTKNCFYFKKKETFHRVLTKDIALIQSDHNYCRTFTVQGDSFTSRISISKLEEMLPAETFFRVHRKFIVQVAHIQQINAQENTLVIGDQEVPISRNNKKALMEMINVVS